MSHDFNVGDHIYGINTGFGDGILKGTIIDKQYTTNKKPVLYYEIHLDNYGQCGILAENTFATYEECLAELKKRNETRINEFCNNIHSIDDLFIMMEDHMHCEEYTDYEAIEAAKRKAKEFGINISKGNER